MTICEMPPVKAPVEHREFLLKSQKNESPCEIQKRKKKVFKSSSNKIENKQAPSTASTASTAATSSGAATSTVVVNVSLSDPKQGKRTRQESYSRVLSVPIKRWTVSLLGGLARTDYKISDSTCDHINCRGVVKRLYIFDTGAMLQWRAPMLSNSFTFGVTVTKEQSLYGSVGFTF